MKFSHYFPLAIFATFCLQGCEQLTPKKTFQGRLSLSDGALTLGDGQTAFNAGEMQVDLKTGVREDSISSMVLQQGGQALYRLPIDIKKPLVYGSFTLEPAEMGIQQRIEGNIQRQFVSEQHTTTDRKTCTFSGICKHQIEKEEESCVKTGADNVDNKEVCTKTKKIVEEYGIYHSCPGWEDYERTYQDANYQLTLLFFNHPLDKTASAMFEGVTPTLSEQTSDIKTKNCSDSAF